MSGAAVVIDTRLRGAVKGLPVAFTLLVRTFTSLLWGLLQRSRTRSGAAAYPALDKPPMYCSSKAEGGSDSMTPSLEGFVSEPHRAGTSLLWGLFQRSRARSNSAAYPALDKRPTCCSWNAEGGPDSIEPSLRGASENRASIPEHPDFHQGLIQAKRP